MKVLLIDPQGIAPGVNIGLGYLSAVLKQNNYDVNVLDLNNNRINTKKRLDQALQEKPEVVGISINSFTEKEGIRLARYCKKNIKTKCILGGPGATINYFEILQKNHDAIDCIMFGESEVTIIDFLDKIKKNKDPRKIKGIAFYSRGVKKNPDREFVNLDSLPFPDYTTFDSFQDNKVIEKYQIVTSRGCPFSCIFCANRCIWKQRFRARSPENVIDEIKHAKEFYKSDIMLICDDNFTLDMTRAKKICRIMISEKIDIPYYMFNGIRADKVDEDLLFLLKKSGCKEIAVGIENGDKETFQL